jgi:hypothetical protein
VNLLTFFALGMAAYACLQIGILSRRCRELEQRAHKAEHHLRLHETRLDAGAALWKEQAGIGKMAT